MLSWTVCLFNYYLLIFHLTKFDGSMYLNGFAISTAELCGHLIIGIFIWQFGIKKTIIGSFSVMAISSLVYMYPIIPLGIWYSTILFVMKLANTCANASVFFGSNAMFKQEVVAIIFALCNLFARFFTMFAPLVAASSGTAVMNTYFYLSLFGVGCGIFIAENSKDDEE